MPTATHPAYWPLAGPGGPLHITPSIATTAELTRAISNLTNLVNYRQAQNAEAWAEIRQHDLRRIDLLRRLEKLEPRKDEHEAEVASLQAQAHAERSWEVRAKARQFVEEGRTKDFRSDLRTFEKELEKRRPW
jgi:hypothetical protein